MSQLDLGGAGGEAHNGSDTPVEIADGLDGGAPTAVQTTLSAVRPSYHGVVRTSSLLMEPVVATSEVEPGLAKAGRHVGFQYLSQLLLTCVPLMAVDLALLVAVIAVSRELMFLFGAKVGLDLAACFLPIASGFLLISAELGLYPGIRLSPVEEFRRLTMAVTSIFAVWIMGMAMMSGGISQERCIFLAMAYGMYMISLPICRGTLRRILAERSWWGFPTLVCGNDSSVVKVYDWLLSNRRLGLRPVGVIAGRKELEIDGDEPWYAGPWSEAREIAAA